MHSVREVRRQIVSAAATLAAANRLAARASPLSAQPSLQDLSLRARALRQQYLRSLRRTRVPAREDFRPRPSMVSSAVPGTFGGRVETTSRDVLDADLSSGRGRRRRAGAAGNRTLRAPCGPPRVHGVPRDEAARCWGSGRAGGRHRRSDAVRRLRPDDPDEISTRCSARTAARAPLDRRPEISPDAPKA